MLRAARRTQLTEDAEFDPERTMVLPEPAYAGADITHQFRILRLGREPEVQCDYPDTMRCEVFENDSIVEPVSGTPGAAMHIYDIGLRSVLPKKTSAF